jgi:hydrogenase expression/formation protein HypC
MCLSVPMLVVEVDGFSARCEALGQQRVLSLLLLQAEPVQPGDFVLGHRGQALRKVPAEEAQASQALFVELLAALPPGGAEAGDGAAPA